MSERALVATRVPTVDYRAIGDWTDQHLASHLLGRRGDDAIALIDHDVALTDAELDERVTEMATGLQRVGVQPGDVVSVMLPNWWEAIVVMQALVRLGAVINPIVPIYRDREVAFILDQCRPRAIIVPRQFRGFDYVAMLGRVRASLPFDPLAIVARDQDDQPLPAGYVPLTSVPVVVDAPTTLVAAGDASDVVLLLYTSGTTASPKGVLHSHQTLDYENRSIIDTYQLSGADCVFMASPITHITGFLYGVLLPSMLGVPCVLLDEWDAATAVRYVEAHHCTFSMGATPFLQGLVDEYERTQSPSALRVFACGGADVPPELVRRAHDALGADVFRVYGSSEFPTFCSGSMADAVAERAESDGTPIGPVEYYVQQGELVARGPELFLGYLDASLNADAFDDDGFFRTGDLIADAGGGRLRIAGRKKDIIIRLGENISAREVEDALYAHPLVREAAVVGVPDARLGERACAFVVVDPGTQLTLADLSSHLDGYGIAKQKYPERLFLTDALPKTASGKVQKFRLREQATSLG